MAHYDAFLLRIWWTSQGGQQRWAIRLEHLPDGQGARLDSLEALVTHLAAVLAAEACGQPASGEQPEGSMKRSRE
jgi:hypothetical protein